MNPALVEEITKIVISKLEESDYSSNLNANSQGLSQGEINRWNQITGSLAGSNSSQEAQVTAKSQPLSSVEIARWNDIINKMNGFKDIANNTMFYKYGN